MKLFDFYRCFRSGHLLLLLLKAKVRAGKWSLWAWHDINKTQQTLWVCDPTEVSHPAARDKWQPNFHTLFCCISCRYLPTLRTHSLWPRWGLTAWSVSTPEPCCCRGRPLPQSDPSAETLLQMVRVAHLLRGPDVFCVHVADTPPPPPLPTQGP